MSDLISRSELKKTLLEYNYTTEHNQIFRYIDEQPIAFDIDKVVSELEKATQYIKIDGKPTSVKAIHPEQAIEIVKRGGVCGGCIEAGGCPVSEDCPNELNVCEWKKQIKTYDWEPSCEPNSTYNVAGVGWFKYCPYCGKKIKAVE